MDLERKLVNQSLSQLNLRWAYVCVWVALICAQKPHFQSIVHQDKGFKTMIPNHSAEIRSPQTVKSQLKPFTIAFDNSSPKFGGPTGCGTAACLELGRSRQFSCIQSSSYFGKDALSTVRQLIFSSSATADWFEP